MSTTPHTKRRPVSGRDPVDDDSPRAREREAQRRERMAGYVANGLNRAVLEALRRHDEAAEAFDAAVALDPGNRTALYNQARSLLAAGADRLGTSAAAVIASQ